jgi:hypothetical protein
MSWAVAGVFFALGVLTRIPFQTEFLWAHDSVLYARAIERFDPLDQRPQAPGYLYYVLLIRGVYAVVGDPNRAMTIVSLVSGAAAIALLYVFVARLYDERTARASGAFLLTAVTFWAYGGIAYPYTLMAALSIGCALLFWRALRAETGRGPRLAIATAAYGIAIGFRSDLAVFLAPLWLMAALAAPRLWGVVSAALGALLVLVWFLVPPLAALPLSAAARRIELSHRRRIAFVLLWTLTPLAIYVPIHVGEYGYVFSMLPGLCVIAARGAIALARGARMPRALPWIVAIVALANAAVFLVSDTPLSAQDVVRRDRGVGERIERLNQPDLAASTIFSAYDGLVGEYYLADDRRLGASHVLVSYDAARPRREMAFTRRVCDPAGACRDRDPVIVVWDDLIRVGGGGWEEIRLPHGAKLRVARNLAEGTRIVIDGLAVELVR